MSSTNILLLLIAVATVIGSVLHGNLAQLGSEEQGVGLDAKNKIIALELENEQLKNEIVSLRQLAEAYGDVILEKEWLEFIEKDWGLEFIEQPQIIRGSSDEISKFAANEWLVNFNTVGLFNRDALFAGISLTPECNMEAQIGLIASSFGHKRATFDYEQKLIVVPLDFDKKNLFDAKELTTALTVALLEQNFPLKEKLEDDPWLARRMVIHGSAIITTQAYQLHSQIKFQMGGAQAKNPVSPEVIKDNNEKLAMLPLYFKKCITAPALFGRDFVEAQFTKEGTRKEAIELALKKATSTLSVMKAAEVPVTNISKSENAALSTKLGALSLFYHANRGKTINPREIANDYISDRAEVFVEQIEGRNANRIKWQIQFSSTKTANQFAKHLKDLNNEFSIENNEGALKIELLQIFPN